MMAIDCESLLVDMTGLFPRSDLRSNDGPQSMAAFLHDVGVIDVPRMTRAPRSC